MSHHESLDRIGAILTKRRQRASKAIKDLSKQEKTTNPYKSLPDNQFWRKSIANKPIYEVDPVNSMPFRIEKNDKVATAGSCFAQHIASRLSDADFSYFVTESAPKGMNLEEAKLKNYGVFSARYGNIYTARQLVQMFDRAYGRFTPLDTVWTHPKSGYVDPFRPQIESKGFLSHEALESSREVHLSCVRNMLEQSDVFIFTLGLTEAWVSKLDGAVFPLAPGVAGGTFDDEKYEFKNFSVDEVIGDLKDFVNRLYSVNPTCRVLLTVSPVPLIATYEQQHVLVSTTYSKSVLRVAAQQICSLFENVSYFPSFEVITGNYNKGNYFEEDLRSVRKEGVDHVMRLFFRHLTDIQMNEFQLNSDSSNSTDDNAGLRERLKMLDQIVCDEDAIDQ